MKNKDFSHLHVHSDFSLLDSLGKSDKYAERAKELGFQALACTDHGNFDGAIKFQKECKKNDIKPILGSELYIVPDASIKEKTEKRGHITCLIKNEQGYQNLLKCLSYANLSGFYNRPRVDYQFFLEHCEGLVVLTGCAYSFLNIPDGKEFFFDLHKKIKDDLYIEVMPHIIDVQNEHNINCLKLSEKTGIQLVGSQDCHYVQKEDQETHDLLLAMQTKKKVNDPDRWRMDCQLHLRTADEMIDAFLEQGVLTRKQAVNSLLTTAEICDKCNFEIPKQEVHLPPVPKWGEENEDEILIDLCEKGFERIFGEKINLRE